MGEQLNAGVGHDSINAPHRTGAFPQHGQLVVVGVVQKVLSLFEVILGSHADDLNRFCVVSSELLDAWPVSPAGWSMGCPVPDDHGTVAVDDVGQRRWFTGPHVEHFSTDQVGANRQAGLVLRS